MALLSQRKRLVSKRGGQVWEHAQSVKRGSLFNLRPANLPNERGTLARDRRPSLSAGDLEKATSMAPQTGLEMLAPPLECRRSGSADRRHWLACQLLMLGPPFSHAVAHDAAQRAPASASRRTSASARGQHRAPAAEEACRRVLVAGAAARLQPSPFSARMRSIRLPPQPSTQLVS